MLPAAHRLFFACSVLGCAGCDQIGSMHNQPRYDPLEPSEFFFDRTSARNAVAGAAPRDKPYAAAEEFQGGPRPELATEVLARGQRLFEINCSVCHGRAGYGDGIVQKRGYPAPPSYHTPRLRALPDEYLFHVISNGLGKMPPYRGKVRPADRWAVIAYVRALQLSQHAPVELLSDEVREKLETVDSLSASPGAKPHGPSAGQVRESFSGIEVDGRQ